MFEHDSYEEYDAWKEDPKYRRLVIAIAVTVIVATVIIWKVI